jgi:hypothetical protein
MSSGRVLHGENEFISLLHRAGVDPELTLNENVKNKLKTFHSKSVEFPKREPTVYENKQSIKRKFEDDDDDDNDNMDGRAMEYRRPIKRLKTVAVVKPSLKRSSDELDEIEEKWIYPEDDK